MVQISIYISDDGISINVSAPNGTKLKFRSADENDAAKIGSGDVVLPEQKADEYGKSPIQAALDKLPPSVKKAGDQVRQALKDLESGKVVMATAVPKSKKELEKIHVDLKDPAHKRKSPQFKKKKICPYCENEFTPNGAQQVFCTTEHKIAFNIRKKDLDHTIKESEQLVDKLEQDNKKSDQEIKKSDQNLKGSKVISEAQKIADENPDLTGKKLCKECGDSFNGKGNFCSDRCKTNYLSRH